MNREVTIRVTPARVLLAVGALFGTSSLAMREIVNDRTARWDGASAGAVAVAALPAAVAWDLLDERYPAVARRLWPAQYGRSREREVMR